jgi:hypothetical protein
MRPFPVILLCLPLFGVETFLRAEDHARAGTQWEGSLKAVSFRDGKPQFNSFDARFVVKNRQEREFTAELWWDNDDKGVAVSGTIDEQGIVRFKVTKELNGQHHKDLVDNGRFLGAIKNKELKGRWADPGNNLRFGEIRVALKE